MLLRTKLIVTFAIIILALVLVCVVNGFTTNRLVEARGMVEHTQKVLERLERIVSLYKDVVNGQRGYLITEDPVFLGPYESAISSLTAETVEAREMTVDNPPQQTRFKSLEDLGSQRVEFCRRIVEMVKTGRRAEAIAAVKSLKGQILSGRIRDLVDEMQNEERRLLQSRSEAADRLTQLSNVASLGSAAIAIFLSLGGAYLVVSSFSSSLSRLEDGLEKVGEGDLEHRIDSRGSDEFSRLADSFNKMVEKMKDASDTTNSQIWLNKGLARLGQVLQGESNLQTAAEKVLSELAQAIGSQHGLFYVATAESDSRSETKLQLLASYAHHERKNLANSFELGQGLIGQCALEKKTITVDNAPDDFIRITSGLGEAKPVQITVLPVVHNDEVRAVIEQASFERLTETQMGYLTQAAENLAVVLDSIASANQTQELLRKEQVLSEELQSQQEELTENNTRLEELTQSLQASDEQLRQQQEELQQSNEELEERARLQAQQNNELEEKNRMLEDLRISIEEKARQLTVTSRYKSEFLSNMSHELRTPLNSLLILSKTLSDNSEGNLTGKQVEFARTIHSAGADLLVLIDDVLDISKIEAGAISLDISEESIGEICAGIISTFDALCVEKGLEFKVRQADDLPRFLKTDGRRLNQVLRNLIANAIKFTEKGSVTLEVVPTSTGWSKGMDTLKNADSVIRFSVLDTGIGIAAEKQEVIFEAFQQADGTTNRKFGGSGLGLAISKELVRLLGGEIRLESELGLGSRFDVYLPGKYSGASSLERGPEPLRAADSGNGQNHTPARLEQPDQSSLKTTSAPGDSPDDRESIVEGDRVILMVVEKSGFSENVGKLAIQQGFKVLIAGDGKSAFSLVRRFRPDAIILDVGLPDKDGWIFLDRLKRDSTTRHIPIQVVSSEDYSAKARRLGAVGFVDKPASTDTLKEMLNSLSEFVSTSQRRLLLVEDNANERQSLEELLDGSDVSITTASTGNEALKLLSSQDFECMVLDLGLPDISGFELLQSLRNNSRLRKMPVIVHTCRILSPDEESELKTMTDTIIIKGARSQERLLDETMLFLHRVEGKLPERKKKMLEKLHLKDPLLAGKTVLIADDDMRHIFAITSLLENHDMEVLYAENGREALSILEDRPDVALILMDVMMPDMDGYQTMQEIRKNQRLKDCPIIALTAKAMKGDREQCIASGASDYLAKPVDSDQLLSLMRVWLY